MDDDGRDINPDRPEDAEAPEEEGASTASIAIDEDPAATPAWQNQQSRYATSVKRWSEPNIGMLWKNERVVTLNGQINSASALQVQKDVAEIMKKGRGWILLQINSHGGFVDVAQSLVSWLAETLPDAQYPLATQAFANCDSAASLVFVTGAYRICDYSTEILIHGARLTLGQQTTVTEAGLNVYKELLQQARREMSAHYQAYTKLTAEEIELRMSTEVPYSSEQALEKGIVEKIIGRRPSFAHLEPPISNLPPP